MASSSLVSRASSGRMIQQADPLLGFHAIHWVFCAESYATARRELIHGWVVDPISDADACVYRRFDHVIVAFRGSTSLLDIRNDMILSRPGHSCQFPKALVMKEWIHTLLEDEPDVLVQLTG